MISTRSQHGWRTRLPIWPAWLKAWAPAVSRADLPTLLRRTLGDGGGTALPLWLGMPSFKQRLESSHYLEPDYVTVQSTGAATSLSILTVPPSPCHHFSVSSALLCVLQPSCYCVCQPARLRHCRSPGLCPILVPGSRV